MPITTNHGNSNPAHGEAYSKKLYVIKFVNDLPQVDGFLWVLQLNTITLTPAHGELYLIQLYVKKFVRDCDRLVVFSGYSGFLHQ